MVKQLFLLVMLLVIIAALGTDSLKNDNKTQVCSIHQNVKKYVILDSDLGSSTDDIFALQYLCRYAKKFNFTLLGVICNRKGEEKARFCKSLLSYYSMPNVPVGLERIYPESHANFVNYCSEPTDTLTKCQEVDNDCLIPEAWILYRKLLVNAPDHSVNIVSIGFLTTLSHLLNSRPDTISPLNGVELVKRKVQSLYLMGTKFVQGSHRAELGYNLKNPSPHYADTVFCKLPLNIDVYISPNNVGKSIGRYINDSIKNDIKDHSNPIYKVYENFIVDDGQYMWDIFPVIQLLEGNDNFFLSEKGRVKIEMADTTIVFEPDLQGNTQFQFIPSEWDKQDIMTYRELILNKIRNSYNPELFSNN